MPQLESPSSRPALFEAAPAPKRRDGFRRLLAALRNSWAGLRHAARHETAIRQELIALAILAPASAFLPVRKLEHLILVLAMLLVLLVEFLNSAIESTVDRISLEHHPLAGRAKDLGSAAVLIALLMCGLAWLVIAGPLVLWLFKK
ncbi:MAG TPA: diacylglycerol kinase [Opitutus sp.]|nr:diacylglycerol kinase [Opitutus sp.]